MVVNVNEALKRVDAACQALGMGLGFLHQQIPEALSQLATTSCARTDIKIVTEPLRIDCVCRFLKVGLHFLAYAIITTACERVRIKLTSRGDEEGSGIRVFFYGTCQKLSQCCTVAAHEGFGRIGDTLCACCHRPDGHARWIGVTQPFNFDDLRKRGP